MDTAKRSLVLIVVFLLFILSSGQMYADSGGWPQYRHDSQRSGRAEEALPGNQNNGLHLQWAYSFGERVEVEVEPIVAAGKVFVGAMNGTMTALHANDGSMAWSFTQAGPIPHTAAHAENRLFFGSLDGHIYALNASNGTLIWKFQTGGPVYAAPAVAGDTVYIGTTAGRFFALDAATGTQRWRYPADNSLYTAFTGAAALSPDGNRVYVGNEDLMARALDAQTGTLVWQRQLIGVGMRSTYPVVSEDGAVVIFVTTKPGVQSYVPTEDYPGVAPGNDPAQTWNSYYQKYPERRATFFLRSTDGAELWEPTAQRYVPLPIPYWGLVEPVLDGSGNAWFPSPGGAEGDGFGPYYLDHDSRLIRVNLNSGIATQVAAREQFQHRPDENGRGTFSGSSYVTTISEDVGAYNTTNHTKTVLFANPIDGFGSHMDPIAPLPSKHLWRYGGTIAMGGVPGSSPAIVANGRVYYISYGWLFALGPNDQGRDPTGQNPITFPARDARVHQFTYPRAEAPTRAELQQELEQRVSDLISSNPWLPYAKFDQPGDGMAQEISKFQLFGATGEKVWILSQALPLINSESLRAQTIAYLKEVAENELFNKEQYQYRTDCLIFSQPGVKRDESCDTGDDITAEWAADNEVLIGERLYAMAAYAEATEDWSRVSANWQLIKELFNRFVSAYDSSAGFCRFPDWHVRKFSLPSQIGAAAGVLTMATQQGDSATASEAAALLDNLLATRVRLGRYVQEQYDTGSIQPLVMRIDGDGVPNNTDIFSGYNNPGELIPLDGDRKRETDVRQLVWYDLIYDSENIHSGAGFMHYPALVGYSPLYPELAERLRRDLPQETQQYVQTYEINAPWWWMSDLAHHTTAGGEHLWHSPSLAHDLFQVKAWVLGEDWNSLLHQLPLPVSINPRYDLYRLHNLATLLSLASVGLNIYLPMVVRNDS